MKQAVKIVIIFLFAGVFSVKGQVRYKDVVFDSIWYKTYTYAKKDGEKLKLDIYTPVNDKETNRYVYLYIHGGGFAGGSHNNKELITFCKNIAKRGYVAVSISYRLLRKNKPSGFGCDCPADEKIKTFRAAVEDLHDATTFLVKKGKKLGISPDKIIISGGSAGAETVLNAAYEVWKDKGRAFKYAGVVAFAGAVPDTSIITSSTAIPSMFFHGTYDNLVPFATAPHHYCKEGSKGYLILHGSYSVAQRLKHLNKPYWLHITCGGTHMLSATPKTKYFDDIMDFCYRQVVRGINEEIRTVISGDQNRCGHKRFGFCDR